MRLGGESQGFLAGQRATGEAGAADSSGGAGGRVLPCGHPPFLLPRQGEETEEVREISPPGGRGDQSRLPQSGHHRKPAVCRPLLFDVREAGGDVPAGVSARWPLGVRT